MCIEKQIHGSIIICFRQIIYRNFSLKPNQKMNQLMIFLHPHSPPALRHAEQQLPEQVLLQRDRSDRGSQTGHHPARVPSWSRGTTGSRG